MDAPIRSTTSNSPPADNPPSASCREATPTTTAAAKPTSRHFLPVTTHPDQSCLPPPPMTICGQAPSAIRSWLALVEIWINPACSKCRTATAALDEAGIDYTVRRYLCLLYTSPSPRD